LAVSACGPQAAFERPLRKLPQCHLRLFGGVTDREDIWARELNALGVATFLVDSFPGTGHRHHHCGSDQLSRLVMVLDAYRALEPAASRRRRTAAS
jgi:hypothetical protein